MAAKIIFIGKRRDLCQSLRRVAVGAGHEFAVAQDLAEAAGSIDPADPPIFFAEPEQSPAENPAHATLDPGLWRRMVWIVPGELDTYVLQMKDRPWVGHLTSGARGISPEDLLATAQKILRNDVFGLEKYLGWGTAIRSKQLHHSLDRLELLEECRVYGEELGVDSRRVSNFCRVLDELVQNAIFHAPRDATGNSIHRFTPRDAAFDLPGAREITVKYGCNGSHMGLSVRDEWGSLEPQTLLAKLEAGVRGDTQVTEDYPGAGIGLYMALRLMNQFIVNLEPSVSAETIGLLDVASVYAEHRRTRRSFHIFLKSSAPPGGGS